MEDKRMNIFQATEFENIRDIIKNSIKKYPNNNAFIIKEGSGKDPEKYADPQIREEPAWRNGEISGEHPPQHVAAE